MQCSISKAPPVKAFPPFNVARLLKTVFAPERGQRIVILIDLENICDVDGFAFLKNNRLSIQRNAYEQFYVPLQDSGIRHELGLQGGDLYAYRITGGSNLDLPDEARTSDGRTVSLEKDVYPRYDLILCISTYSATAPLTAFAKRYGFRGATLHGLNETILRTGLAVDYEQVSQEAEKLRLGMTHAKWVEIDFEVAGHSHTLHLDLGEQEAQKSHGLCRGHKPDVANLPAGEVYFVPVGAEGTFPMKYEDGTLGLMRVERGRIVHADFLNGNSLTVQKHNEKLAGDPVVGEIGELGFGTQILPPSGQDIQDEKIRGTVHVATGRSDHLGGTLTPDKFKEKSHATHDDILFSPTKTPEIFVKQVRMLRHGETEILIEEYQPSHYLNSLLSN